MTAPRDSHTRWKRLEEILTAIKGGETITIDMLVTETGLAAETVETVLNALTKAELFERQDRNVFIRRSLFDVLDPCRKLTGRPTPSERRETAIIVDLSGIQDKRSAGAVRI